MDFISGQPADREWSSAIVIQGQYYGIHTIRAINEALGRNPPDVLVIYSCCNELDDETLIKLGDIQDSSDTRFVYISSRVPDRSHEAFWRTNGYNQNLQRLTSFLGIQYAHSLGIETCLKIRSDSFFATRDVCRLFKEQIDKHPIIPDRESEESRIASGIPRQRGRIAVDQCILIPHLFGTTYIGDNWLFGYTDDMLIYFDMREGCYWNGGKGIATNESPESNLGLCWKRHMRIRPSIKIRELLGRYFIVTDRSIFLYFWARWHKYERFLQVDQRKYLCQLGAIAPERCNHRTWLDLVAKIRHCF